MSLTRRDFLLLGGLVSGAGLTAAACVNQSVDPASTLSTGEVAPTTTEPASTTTTSTTTTTTTTTVAPVAAPPFDGQGNPFALGVASGDPDPTSVVLWTRLLDPSGAALASDYAVAVDVSEDPSFEHPVISTITNASAAHGNSVHFVASELLADTWYWYRFRIGDSTSAIGRTRTTPIDNTPLRLGFASCQNWESGAYAAHRHLAEADLDLFVWLGDYIYEYGPRPQGVVTSAGERSHNGEEVQTLDDYRNRYALYRSDPHLQAHHAARPWVVTWDDHEVDNNYAGLSSQDGQDETAFAARQAAAQQAWWEHMPVRLDPPTDEGFDIYRTTQWGTLLALHMLDGRQYRDPQPTDGELIDIDGLDGFGLRRLGATARDPNHTMLGADQRRWLEAEVASSEATWNVLGNQVFMHGLDAFPGDSPATNTDTWDGYFGERQSLLANLSESASNLIVLSGDFHASSAADLRSDPFSPDTPVIATEFMAPAISSIFPAALVSLAPIVMAFNPQVKHFEPRNGYMSCEVTTDQWVTTLHTLDDVTNEASAITQTAQFTVQAGTPGIS